METGGKMDTSSKIGLKVDPFDYDGEDCGYEWQCWQRAFEYCMNAAGVTSDNEKFSLLLHFAGKKVQEIYRALPEANEMSPRGPFAAEYRPQRTQYERAVAQLNEFFVPQKDSGYQRHILRQIKQKEGENVGMFAMRLRLQAEKCDYSDNIDSNIKEMIVSNCRSDSMRRELLKMSIMRGSEVSLAEVLKVAKAFEGVNEQEKPFRNACIPPTLSDPVNRIMSSSTWVKPKETVENNMIECSRCGYTGHRANDPKCPARGKKCNKCGGSDHFMRKCRTKTRARFDGNLQNQINSRRLMHKVEDAEPPANKRPRNEENSVKHISEKGEFTYLFCIGTKDAGNRIKCKIGGVEIMAIIDSGSKYNLLDERTWDFLKSAKIVVLKQQKETDKIFKAYGGKILTVLGVFQAYIEVAKRQVIANFYVITEEGTFLIGSDTAILLGILKINNEVNQVQIEEKEKIGKIKDILVEIPLRSDVQPVVQPYRRIPVALEKAVDRKIDELLQQDIIEEVHGPSRWISPVVAIPKDGDVRLCIDMRRANEAVERENHPLPVFEDFLPHIATGKWYSKLDVKMAFYQVEISDKSREITTFITRKGLFRYKRLMFGITCAPEIFQKVMEQILCGCEGCLNFIDDVIVFGSTKQEHDERLQKVLVRLQQRNVTLNTSKCVYGVSEIQFLGHKLTPEGISPTMDKVLAVKQFRVPENSEEVRSFLGLVNFVGKFIPDLATVTEPLRVLTKSNAKFIWENTQQQAFDWLKSILSSESALGYFNEKDKTQLVADASPVGLGAVLIQYDKNGVARVISYAAKSLSEAEKRYAQTEKEALALVWACERFHFYLYGREFELISDHKALEVIFGSRSKPCARIERWVLRLQSYKYKILYKPGKMNIADPLSRLVADVGTCETFDEHAEHYVHWVATLATPVAIKMREIDEHSRTDNIIQAVKNGLSENDWCEEVNQFKIFKTELCFCGNILLRSNKIVIPQKLQQRVLDLAHEGHPGMSVMKRRLRTKVWWPKIDHQVEEVVKKCRGCALVSAPPAPEPLTRKELPSKPWQHVAIDYLGPLPSGQNLLVIVDYFSRFIEIVIMTKIDTTQTIKELQTIFIRFGYPLTITADNGPQFISEEFGNFCEINNIKLIKTIPYWPQQNGEVERQNRSILKRLQIAHQTGKNWKDELEDFLLMYRSTPHSTTGKTPSEMLFGWNIRDKVPSIDQPFETDAETRDRDKINKFEGKQYADQRRNAKQSTIEEGDKVLLKQTVKSNKLTSNFEPTTYTVIKKNGPEAIVHDEQTDKHYRRNVAHLKKVNEEQPARFAHQEVNEEQPAEAPKRTIRQPGHLKDFVTM